MFGLKAESNQDLRSLCIRRLVFVFSVRGETQNPLDVGERVNRMAGSYLLEQIVLTGKRERVLVFRYRGGWELELDLTCTCKCRRRRYVGTKQAYRKSNNRCVKYCCRRTRIWRRFAAAVMQGKQLQLYCFSSQIFIWTNESEGLLIPSRGMYLSQIRSRVRFVLFQIPDAKPQCGIACLRRQMFYSSIFRTSTSNLPFLLYSLHSFFSSSYF